MIYFLLAFKFCIVRCILGSCSTQFILPDAIQFLITLLLDSVVKNSMKFILLIQQGATKLIYFYNNNNGDL